MAPRIRFDFSSLSRRGVIILIIGLVVLLAAIVGLVSLLTGDGQPSEEFADITPPPTPTLAPTDQPTQPPAGPPTETATPLPTATLEPYVHQVESGETLYYIIQLYGYLELNVVAEILTLNEMATENDLFAGQNLLIPRQTPTPGPVAEEPVVTEAEPAEAETGATPSPSPTGVPAEAGEPSATRDVSACGFDNPCVSNDGQYWIHVVQEGETVSGLAFAYETRVDAILEANGFSPDPIISIGQQILVPILVTLTPTLTPTGGPDSTATPIPTVSPPSLLAPADGAEFARGQNVVLQWIADRILQNDEHYLVVITNLESGVEHRATTRSNVYRLPAELQPGLGQTIQYDWRVEVVSGSAIDAPAISGPATSRLFSWGS